jgi:hypothetical protein
MTLLLQYGYRYCKKIFCMFSTTAAMQIRFFVELVHHQINDFTGVLVSWSQYRYRYRHGKHFTLCLALPLHYGYRCGSRPIDCQWYRYKKPKGLYRCCIIRKGNRCGSGPMDRQRYQFRLENSHCPSSGEHTGDQYR